MKPFDPKKPVQTRDGRKARVLAVNLKGACPIAAAIEDSDEEFVTQFFTSGRLSSEGDTPDDLVNPVHKVPIWVNVYSDGSYEPHATSASALMNGRNRESCFQVDVEIP